MSQCKLKKTLVIDVKAARVTTLTATLDDGTTINVAGPISIGDWAITDSDDFVSILSNADFEVEKVAE